MLSLALFAACDGNNDTDTPSPTAAPTEASEPDSDESVNLPSETGEDAIFWRTEDGFQSIRAGVPYKVVLRVTNGYDEETIVVVASRQGGGGEATYFAPKVDAGEGEAPGSYYVFNLDLPNPGRWQITVEAGDDVDVMDIMVKPGSS